MKPVNMLKQPTSLTTDVALDPLSSIIIIYSAVKCGPDLVHFGPEEVHGNLMDKLTTWARTVSTSYSSL